jgi:hypothetical protein
MICDLRDLQDRLSKLEQQNRRFKQLGAAVLVVAAVIMVMGQAPAKKTVEANEFILRDGSGNIRVKIGVNPSNHDSVGISLVDPDGTERVLLYDNGLLLEQAGQRRAFLSDGMLGLSNSKGRQDISLVSLDGVGASLMWRGSEKNGGLFFDGSSGGASLVVGDDEGFETAIGSAHLKTRTGESHTTSAASVILFDKDKDVIWKAP